MAKRKEPLRFSKAVDDQYCNLCLEQRPLTDDHVPTKGWGNNKMIEVRRFKGEQFIQQQATQKCRRGLTFKTLCAKCNNERIGGSGDAALADLVAVCRREFARGRRTFKARLRPNAILRSILGHIVAIRNYTERDMTLDKAIRAYLVDERSLSPEVKVHVWPFLIPRRLVIARDFVFTDVTTRETSGILNVIKFEPIAAVVQFGGTGFAAPSFHEFSTLSPGDELEIPLSFSAPFDAQFPEEAAEIDPRYIVVAGKGFTDGIERSAT